MLIRIAKDWEIPEREAAPEAVYMNRRKFLASMGVTGAYALALLSG